MASPVIAADIATNTTISARRPTSVAPEAGEERVEGREQQDDEHRREDQEHEREQQLDRRLLRPFLCCRATALAHLERKRAHDLADRDTERLALKHRADERAHRRGVAAHE